MAQEQSSAPSTSRCRGGYRQELRTIPEGIASVRPSDKGAQVVKILTNFVRIKAMAKRDIYQYRVDFEPNLESVSLRARLFRRGTENLFESKVTFDGMSDARSSSLLKGDDHAEVVVENPQEPDTNVTIKIKKVGIVGWGSFEMVRIYNMHMKQFLKALGFFSVGKTGAYVHENLKTMIGDSLVTVRGYKTGASVCEQRQILMNLESCHKLMQKQNVLRNMRDIRQQAGGSNFQAALRANLTGKLVVTSYNKVVYRIEDINFTMSPMSTFRDNRAGRDITYKDYYQNRYDLQIREQSQPLLLVVPNDNRRRDQGETHEIYLIPELCNIAGLTDAQRNDNRLRIDLIKCSQIPPQERVNHLRTFLSTLHNNDEVKNSLQSWGYSYEDEPVSIDARIMEREGVGCGSKAMEHPNTWDKVEQDGGFERHLSQGIVKKSPFPKLAVVIGRSELDNERKIMDHIRRGLSKVGCMPDGQPIFCRIDSGDSPNHYTRELRSIPDDVTATIVILKNQNKERYDAIKKTASVELGMITQVVTSKLMCDDRKASGAAMKIGIQLAAKLGGEPWYIYIPLNSTMICGYDTYHDTAERGRSYGAFVASMNGRFSRWYSKADSHERLDELSSHLTENLVTAMKKWHGCNKGLTLDRLIIYRDGVGDGQLEHVFNVEVKDIKKAVAAFNPKIRLTFVVVNKRIGARFYLKTSQGIYNPGPGTVVDDVVTRQERYDFYLISQSTRNGTVCPTYYNIIYDESGLDAGKIQMLSFKLCFLYYNWSGTVRVPAPCQYAHKLALLCGEHLHAVPNVRLDDRLHFL